VDGDLLTKRCQGLEALTSTIIIFSDVKMKYSIARHIEYVVPPSSLILTLGVLSSQFLGF
jgi:hypothetical protein